MSLQQGRMGVRSTVTFRYAGHFTGFCPLSGLFLGRFQRPNTAPPSAAAGPLAGRMPHGCAARRRREPGAAFDPRPCRFLNATGTDAPPPRADTIFQTSAISGPKLAFGPCRADPPSYMRLTVAISRIIGGWGLGWGRRPGPSQPAATRRI